MRLAGQEIMEIYESDNIKVDFKKDESPLTEADRRSHRMILEYLAKLTPNIPIVSEEAEVEPETNSWYWLVDPLDSTVSFIENSEQFAVMAALMHEQHPVFGVIHTPAMKIDYYGGVSLPAAKIEFGAENEIHVGSELNDPLEVLTSRMHDENQSRPLLKKIGPHHISQVGSGLKFGRVADGSADVYIRQRITMEWDTAAGQAIVEAAGGKMLAIDGSRFSYGKAERKNPGFVVYNPLLKFEKILKSLK